MRTLTAAAKLAMVVTATVGVVVALLGWIYVLHHCFLFGYFHRWICS